jgi:hypothetical protein
MIKYLFISLLAVALSVSTLKAKNPPIDSLVKVAQLDVKKFRLNDTDMNKFKTNRHNANSDYFKPGKSGVSDTTLLADSVYVKAYRTAAYNKTRKRRTVWHHVWVGALFFEAVGSIVIMAVVFSPGYKGR